MVIRYRFDAFRDQFGREPKPTEPLFFDHSKSRPTKASLREAREQIEAAAAAAGIKATPVLRLLKLDSFISEGKADRIGQSPAQPVTNGARSGVSANRVQSKPGSAFERFARNERLRRLHNITREELKTLSSLAMMGEIRNSRDLLYILNVIREQMELR